MNGLECCGEHELNQGAVGGLCSRNRRGTRAFLTTLAFNLQQIRNDHLSAAQPGNRCTSHMIPRMSTRISCLEVRAKDLSI